MDEQLLADGKAKVLALVDKFFEEQLKYMTDSPKDYEGCSPEDFVTWFYEWDTYDV